MTEEEKRKLTTGTTGTTSTGGVTPIKGTEPYKSQYTDQIKGLYDKITTRPQFDFSYDPSEDAMYNQYVDRYMALGKQAMRDTMGQAAGLTGGYGSSYAQGVGQQAYDTYLQGANDKLSEFAGQAYDLAYQRYADEGAALDKQYGMLGDLEDTDYARYQDQITRQGEAYDRAAALITSAGYMPSADELAAAGMSEEAAKALQYQWAAANPQMAYNKGILTADEVFQLTGSYPIGYNAPGAGGGQYWDGGHWGPDSGDGDGDEEPYTQADIQALMRAGATDIAGIMRAAGIPITEDVWRDIADTYM